jgi:hypothetical protein
LPPSFRETRNPGACDRKTLAGQSGEFIDVFGVEFWFGLFNE